MKKKPPAKPALIRKDRCDPLQNSHFDLNPFLQPGNVLRSSTVPQKSSAVRIGYRCGTFWRRLPLGFELVLKEKCMNQKAKPHKQSLVEGGQNGIWVLGICRFAPEEFGNKD